MLCVVVIVWCMSLWCGRKKSALVLKTKSLEPKRLRTSVGDLRPKDSESLEQFFWPQDLLS